MKKRWKIGLLLRRVFVILLLLIEIFVLGFIIFGQGHISQITQIISWGLGVVLALKIAAQHEKSGYKVIWIFFSLLFPLFAWGLYLMQNVQLYTKRFGKRLSKIEEKTNLSLFLPETAYNSVENIKSPYLPQISYLQNFAGFPVYKDNATEYLTPGEKFFERLLPELKKAEKYIFLEFFIVEEGKMWNSILEILKDKVKQGVLVRVVYDDLGCFLTLPSAYSKKLKEYGIECQIFNKFKPFLSTVHNNRDHRKIISIDGKVAFTGGINLADEYINEYEKHGHWKDSAIMIKGTAAWSLTVMFLQMWEFVSKSEQNLQSFFPEKQDFFVQEGNGFIQPYSDSPMDKENTGEHVYLQIINNAKKYVYINTPYLIVDDSMVSALSLAAKSSVDVRIVTPQRWDKKIVHLTTRSYYRELIAAGVKIYEYTGGFMHAKTFVSDDIVATVGTTNLDYRSLYLHFECGVFMCETSAIKEIKDDFVKTVENCQQISLEDCKTKRLKRFFEEILRFFAPLM